MQKPGIMRVTEAGPSWRYFSTRGPGFTIYNLHFPLWLTLVAAGAISLVAWVMHRRRRAGDSACPYCNYDLTGLPPGSPCPECARLPDH